MAMRRHQAEQGLGEALPGFAGDVVFAQAAGDGVEEGAHLVLALVQDAAHGGLVGGGFGDFVLGARASKSCRIHRDCRLHLARL